VPAFPNLRVGSLAVTDVRKGSERYARAIVGGTQSGGVTAGGTTRRVILGMRNDGAWEFAQGDSTTANTAPWALADAHPNSVDAVETKSEAKLASIMWGGNLNAYPPPNFDTVAANLSKAGGYMIHYDFSLGSVGLPKLLDAYYTGTDSTRIANRNEIRTNVGKVYQQIKDYGWPVWHRPMHEMQGTWFPWGLATYDANGVRNSVGMFTAAEFVQLWRNQWQICADVHSGQRDGVPSATFGASGTPIWGTGTHTGNIAFCWCCNYFLRLAGGGIDGRDPTPWWPGGAYVDWTGFDGYHRSSRIYTPASKLFGDSYDVCAQLAPTKPMAISEFGIMQGIPSPGKAAWFDDFFTNFLPSRPLLKYVSYYNQAGPDGNDVHVDEDELARQAWARGCRSSVMLTGPYAYDGSAAWAQGNKPPVPSGGAQQSPTTMPFKDTFNRVIASGWGTADGAGGDWSIDQGAAVASDVSCDGARGRFTLPSTRASTTYVVTLAKTSVDFDITVTVASDQDTTTGGGDIPWHIGLRYLDGANHYRPRLGMNGTNKNLYVVIEKIAAGTQTTLSSFVSLGVAYVAGDRYKVRVQAIGTNPTTLRVRAWKEGTTEPGTWHAEVTDSTAALQTSGRLV
jgi:hypothetical protein